MQEFTLLLIHLQSFFPHSASWVVCVCIGYTWSVIRIRRLLLIPSPVTVRMQTHCSYQTQTFSLSGGKWKWLEHRQQLIRCFHCRALTTKSKQTDKYWEYKITVSTLGVAFYFSSIKIMDKGKYFGTWASVRNHRRGQSTKNFLKCFQTSFH